MFVFFQAEDGIRDLVRSRGLGDVYKRQLPGHGLAHRCRAELTRNPRGWPALPTAGVLRAAAVSYTPLTLPTSDLV